MRDLLNSKAMESLHIQNRMRERVQMLLQTPRGKRALENAIDELVYRGTPREEASMKAVSDFEDRLKKPEMEQMERQFAVREKEIEERQSQTKKEIVEIQESIRLLK